MTHRFPKLCRTCELVPPVLGIGFHPDPRRNPRLSLKLREGVLWVCDAPECITKAKNRAKAAAVAEGSRAPVLARVHSPKLKEFQNAAS